MGQRANLAIVENGQYELYYNHWCANTIPEDVFWGPEIALAFIRSQHKVGAGDWMDEVWCEGGVVVDLDRKMVTLFGGEDIKYGVLEQRLFLALMRNVWEGWEIRWTRDEVCGLANAAGFPGEKLLSTKSDFAQLQGQATPPTILASPQEREWVDAVGSILFRSGEMRLLPLDAVFGFLGYGESILKCAHDFGQSVLDLSDFTKTIPVYGLHIDESNRTLEFWGASTMPLAGQRLRKIWPGWKIISWDDRYESHLEKAKGLLTFPSANREKLLLDMVDSLMRGSPAPPLDLIREIPDLRDAQINPDVYIFKMQHVSRETKQLILDRAIAKLKANLA